MTERNINQLGSCRCGRIEMQVTAQPILTMACHCRGCQKMSGSAFSLSAAIPSQGFKVLIGEPVIGGLHGASRHYHCPYCMSWLFSNPAGIDFFVNIRPTMFDQMDWMEPFIETCTTERLPWAVTSARHSYSGFPPPQAFQPLMQEFAEHLSARQGL